MRVRSPLRCSPTRSPVSIRRARWSSTAPAATAPRSPPACSSMLGSLDVSDLLGGYGAWEGAGLPTVDGRRRQRRRRNAPGRRPHGEGARRCRRLAPRRARTRRVADRPHAPAAMLMPMGQVRTRLAELPRDRKIVVVCRSGGRSAAVTDSLRAWGFDAVNLSGRHVRLGRRRSPGHHRRRRRPRRASGGAAELRDVDPRTHRRCGHAQRPLLRPQPLPHAGAQRDDVAPRGQRSRRASVALEPARSAEHAVANARRHTRVRRQRTLDVQPFGRWRAMAPRRGKHRRVDRRAAGRGARPRRPATRRQRDRAPGGRHRNRRGVASRSTSSVACRSTTRAAPRPCSPTR